jgi:acetolactate synthase-1/2/3 large subunit
VAAAVHQAMEIKGTVIIDFIIESHSNVFPMVIPGTAITNMIEETVQENE